MHYYQFNIGDYRRDTAHLSLLEHGVYRQLLDWMYLEQAPIPKETEKVFRRLSAKTEEDKKAIQTVLEEFFILTDDGYTQPRVLKQIADYTAKAERARKAGKLGGRPSKTEKVSSGLSKKTETKANHKPLTNNQEPILSNRETIPPTIDEVRQYCIDRGNGIDPEKFCAHYTSNGWRVGKAKMVSWKSAIITWEKSRSGNGGTHQQDTRSRAKRVADRFDEIGRASLERERALGGGNSQTVPGPISPPLDFGD